MKLNFLIQNSNDEGFLITVARQRTGVQVWPDYTKDGAQFGPLADCPYLNDMDQNNQMFLGDDFEFMHYDEPYGNKQMINCKFRLYTWNQYLGRGTDEFMKNRIEKNLGFVSGKILKGGTTSRLFHATSYRDQAGEDWVVDCVSIFDLHAGYKRTVAM